MQTKVKQVMKTHPELVRPNDTLQDAAQKMKDLDCGVLPVGTEEDVEGIITDRDIVIRAIAEGKDPAQEKVRDYMTEDVQSCNENDTIRDAADQMREAQISRLVVKNSQGNMCGILSFGAIIRKDTNVEEIADIVEHVTGRKVA